LLFLTSALNLSLTVLQIFLGGLIGLVKFLPILFSCTIPSIYFGYYKGGLGDSTFNRAKGWLYLMNCSVFYSALIVSYYGHTFEATKGVIWVVSSIVPYLVGYILSTSSTRLIKNIYRICDRPESDLDSLALEESGWATVYFSLSSYILMSQKEWDFMVVIASFLLLVPGLLYERSSLDLDKKRNLKYKITKRKARPSLSRILASTSFILLVVWSILSMVQDLPALIVPAVSVALLICVILAVVLGSRTSIKFEEHSESETK